MVLLCLLQSSCARITPTVDAPREASFSGDTQNSGIIRQFSESGADGKEVYSGYEVDESFRSRYNAFIERYGTKFFPPIKKDFQLFPIPNVSTWYLSLEGAEKLQMMILFSEREAIK